MVVGYGAGVGYVAGPESLSSSPAAATLLNWRNEGSLSALGDIARPSMEFSDHRPTDEVVADELVCLREAGGSGYNCPRESVEGFDEVEV